MATTKPKIDAPNTEAPGAPAAPTAKRQGVNDVYYIVNPAGAIHGCDRAHAANRLKTAGWRLAGEDEIDVYLGQKIQRGDRPICAPWTPDPDKQLEALA
jgi:hypothetical protein